MPKRSVTSGESDAKRTRPGKDDKEVPGFVWRMEHKPETDTLKYLSGFGNSHLSEALPGAVPKVKNNPKVCPYGLYAEQLSGTAFTRPRHMNQRSWLYRVQPSVMHVPFKRNPHAGIESLKTAKLDPNQMRWSPQPFPKEPTTFWSGLSAVGSSGDPTTKVGLAVYLYACNTSMEDEAMMNADGDFLIVPQTGTLHIQTEFGFMNVAPREICVIQRGIRFRVAVDGETRGYICEVYGGHFQLPDLGPIGSNGLANARDFQFPVAAYEDRSVAYTVHHKYGGEGFTTVMKHSPFNVVGYHGNYVPYKYDLDKFNCMNTVTYDHPDPSIYTVLTCPSATPGLAVCDFAIFPPRWMVMDAFRPPYYHRNTMSEYMGMVYGKYDAKKGFVPGGGSLHSTMTPHGPDADTFYKASTIDASKPEFFDAGLAFMFETCFLLKLTDMARTADFLDKEYHHCWDELPKVFDPENREVTIVPPSGGGGGGGGAAGK